MTITRLVSSFSNNIILSGVVGNTTSKNFGCLWILLFFLNKSCFYKKIKKKGKKGKKSGLVGDTTSNNFGMNLRRPIPLWSRNLQDWLIYVASHRALKQIVGAGSMHIEEEDLHIHMANRLPADYNTFHFI